MRLLDLLTSHPILFKLCQTRLDDSKMTLQKLIRCNGNVSSVSNLRNII